MSIKSESWILERRSNLVKERQALESGLEGMDEAEDPEGYWDVKAELDCLDARIALLEEVLEWGREQGG